jgi:phosphoribosylaminoimidazolecarboxamide formyltransferase/IMP cyclohydrolase
MTQKNTALLSAFDKTGLDVFAQQLVNRGWDILASGGSAKFLTERGIPVTDVATIVGAPILGHRVVTLSREIHAALLATNSPEDQAELAQLGIPRIDLVYVDLYPLEETIQKGGTLNEVIEKTDIGGPTMLRSAAKGRRIVLSDKDQFAGALDFIDQRPHSSEEMAQAVISSFVSRAEKRVADYCLASAVFHEKFAFAGLEQ